MESGEFKGGDIVTWHLAGKCPQENMIILKVGKRIKIGYTPEHKEYETYKRLTHWVPLHNLTKAV